MAIIKIKGRTDPIRIPNDRARTLKARWLGDPARQVEKAPRGDLVDLGDWCGEYGQIASIELDKAPPVPKEENDAKDEDRLRLANEKFRKSPPEHKAKNLDKFRIAYMTRHGYEQPTPEVYQRAYAIQVEYFKAHLDALVVPSEAYGDLLPPRRSSLSEKMKIQ